MGYSRCNTGVVRKGSKDEKYFRLDVKFIFLLYNCLVSAIKKDKVLVSSLATG